MHTVSESIFSGQTVVIFLADVQHIEKWDRPQSPGIRVITKHTRWDADAGDWTNAIWINQPEAATFMEVMCRYRSELEADTLMDLRPDAKDLMQGFDNAIDAIKRA